MRLIHKTVEKTPGRVCIKATWLDNFRRPAEVKIVTQKNVNSAAPFTLIEGDPADVMKTMNGIAQIAWGMGWRPEGLDAALAHAVRTHGAG